MYVHHPDQFIFNLNSLQGACYCSYNMFLIMIEYGNGVLS